MTTGSKGSQTHLPMQAYRGKINRDNIKKHSAMLFFLPMRSTARITIKSPAANIKSCRVRVVRNSAVKNLLQR